MHDQESRSPYLKVALISDSPAMRIGLKATLNMHPSMTIDTDDVSADANVVDVVVRTKPRVIIIDLELAGGDPLALIRALRSAAADSSILVIGGLNDSKLTVKALLAGAEGVVLTIQPPAVLYAAIESLSGFAPRALAQRPADSADGRNGEWASMKDHDPMLQGPGESLTTREREIVQLIAKGLRNKEIADRLCISETTVRHYLTTIFSKVQVSTRQQLLIMAHQSGFVELVAPVDDSPFSVSSPPLLQGGTEQKADCGDCLQGSDRSRFPHSLLPRR
jgi:DNA-binding NarL/FixJ family response regulator